MPANTGKESTPLGVTLLLYPRTVGKERAHFECDADAVPTEVDLDNLGGVANTHPQVPGPTLEPGAGQPACDGLFLATAMPHAVGAVGEEVEQELAPPDARSTPQCRACATVIRPSCESATRRISASIAKVD